MQASASARCHPPRQLRIQRIAQTPGHARNVNTRMQGQQTDVADVPGRPHPFIAARHPLDQFAGQRQAKPRPALKKIGEVLRRQAQQYAVTQGDDGGASGLLHDDAHLPDGLATSDLPQNDVLVLSPASQGAQAA